MELSLPPCPSSSPGCGGPRERAYGGVASEAADDVVLARNEATTNAILYGSRRGQPVRVMVRVNDDLIQASVLDHGPDLPAQPPSDADTDALAAGGGSVAAAPAGG